MNHQEVTNLILQEILDNLRVILEVPPGESLIKRATLIMEELKIDRDKFYTEETTKQ